MSALKRSAVLAVALHTGACGMIAQSVVGWREIVPAAGTAAGTAEAKITVQTVPIGAMICRQDDPKTCTRLGPGPHVDLVPAQVTFFRSEPRYAALIGGTVAEVAVIGGIIGALSEDNCNEPTCANLVGFSLLGLVLGTIVDMGVVMVRAGLVTAKDLDPKVVVSPQSLTYRAEREGYASVVSTVRPELDLVVRLDLVPEAKDSPTAIPFDRAAAVLAVLPITGSAPTAVRLAVDDRLRTKIVGSGLRVIDRGLSGEAVRKAACNSEDCEVDIGRELAASHLIRVVYEQADLQCHLQLELIDLAREAVISAAKAAGACDDAKALDLMIATTFGRLLP